jgi:hypothetical protein
MRDQWAKELRKAEEDADLQKISAEKETINLRNSLDKQIEDGLETKKLLENIRAENASLCQVYFFKLEF